MNKTHWAIALWLRLQEPRIVTLAQTIIYALCLIGGTTVLFSPPVSIEVVYGPYITFTWGIFAVIGGILGIYAAPTGKWLIEKPAIIACGTAATLYAGFIVSLQITAHGNRWAQLCFVLMVIAHFVGRYVRIRPFSYEPGK